MNIKIKKLQDRLYFHSKILARDFGLLDGNSKYCKFVVVSRGRSGSNLLLSLLDSHSQVITFGELFREPDSIGWDRPKYREYLQSQKLISLMKKNPEKFLEKEVFRKYPSKISAVGFKIFYYHAKQDSRKGVWNFLQAQKDLKIIHLKRNNYLRNILSLKKAFITNEWAKKDTDKKKKKVEVKELVVSLDYEECLKTFNKIQEQIKGADLFFDKNQKIDVSYEDLSRDYKSEMKKIQDFLQLDQESVSTNLEKQNNLPLSQSISNYFELKAKFKNTPWIVFFED